MSEIDPKFDELIKKKRIVLYTVIFSMTIFHSLFFLVCLAAHNCLKCAVL